MKRKTNRIPVLVFMMALMAFALLPVASYAGSLAGQPYDCGDLDPNSAQVKPAIALSQVKLTEVPDDRRVNVELSVSGAAGSYCSTGLYVEFDSRLKLIEATKGTAGSGLADEQYKVGDSGIFLMTDGSGDNGKDGVLWNLKFELPENWAPQDKYPVELYNYTKPTMEILFSNAERDEEGQLMQAYAFTQGITQGYILIDIEQPKATLKEKPTAADLTYNAERQELIKEDGEAERGTLQYAISASSTTAPASGWTDNIPAMTYAEKYNVWVKVKGDSSHADSDPECVPAEIKKAPLTITAKNQTLIYNGEIQGEGDTAYDDAAQIAERVTVEGLKGSDTLTSITIFSQGKEIGEYPITLYAAAIGKDGMQTGNYYITLVDGTLFITKAKSEPTPTPSVNKTAAKIALDAGMKGTSSDGKVTANWGKVNGATSYVIFAAYCDDKTKCEKINTVNGDVSAVKITKLYGKSLNPKKHVKYYVVAYQTVNGKKVKVAKSITAHVAYSKSTKYTNPKKVKVKKSSYTLKKGKKAKIKSKLVLQKKGKKTLHHEKKFRYASSNTKVAKVSKKGKITAVGKGNCTIYVYAVNGVSKKITVKVK